MPAPKPKDKFVIRGKTQVWVAAYLGVSEQWFINNRAKLRAAGLPEPDALTGRYDRKAVSLWYDARSGILRAAQAADDDPWRKAVEELEEDADRAGGAQH